MRVFNNEKLKKLRLERKLSVRKFTFDLYINNLKTVVPQTVEKWEKGVTVPNFNNAVLIADFFGLKMEDFIKETK
tara:strand:+ start:100 stop:324 length:225 start_codon:yes stop_codon:yes gene_type:complete